VFNRFPRILSVERFPAFGTPLLSLVIRIKDSTKGYRVSVTPGRITVIAR
jgi:hypothetical protein